MSEEKKVVKFKPTKAVVGAIAASFAWIFVWLTIEQFHPKLPATLGGYGGIIYMLLLGGMVWGILVVGLGIIERTYLKMEREVLKSKKE